MDSTTVKMKKDDFELLAEWIETDVIAEAIKDAVEESGKIFTFEKGKKVWLNFLETELWEGLKSTIKYGFSIDPL